MDTPLLKKNLLQIAYSCGFSDAASAEFNVALTLLDLHSAT
jgi:hypothetical protein